MKLSSLPPSAWETDSTCTFASTPQPFSLSYANIYSLSTLTSPYVYSSLSLPTLLLPSLPHLPRALFPLPAVPSSPKRLLRLSDWKLAIVLMLGQIYNYATGEGWVYHLSIYLFISAGAIEW